MPSTLKFTRGSDASMRPRLKAAENAGNPIDTPLAAFRFNEAAA